MQETLLDRRASFTDMQTSTREDWAAIAAHYMPYAADLGNRVLRHVRLLDGDSGGFAVDRLQHSLQTATRALRGGEDEEYVVCALLHDMGDTLGPWNHAEVAASVLRPFVSPDNLWMVEKHGIFQGYYFFHHLGLDRNMREQFRVHPQFERTALFCEKYDGPAFDPNAETLSLEFFEPMVQRLFAQPKHSIYRQPD